MSFASLAFVLFLPVLCALYWACPRRWRNALLLAASVLFYMLPDPTYGPALVWVWVTSYAAVRRVRRKGATRLDLWAGVAAVLLPMVLLKVRVPIVEAWFPQASRSALPGLNWVFPLGLSCYTLQAVSLVVDVYKRRTVADRSPVNHALYVSFLPTVTSGPIQHSTSLYRQIAGRNGGFDARLAVDGAKRLMWGLFLKVVVADRFGIYVDSVLDHCEHYNSPTVLIALLCYTVQIYCDFAGYSHMAIGTAGLLGYTLPDNFRRPLLSAGLRELWTRWHISLSSWMRDYVYIALGGSRCGRWRSAANVLATFAVSGLWHGVRLSYLCWGLGHGLAVAAERWLPLERWRRRALPRALCTIATVLALSVLWAFFREHVGLSLKILRVLFTGGFAGGWIIADPMRTHTTLAMMLVGLVVVAAHDVRQEWFPCAPARWRRGRGVASLLWHVCLLVLVLAIGVLDTSQFIYLRF
ncbi:MAG: MBOAT family protein [Muribaculaceae bacterium]|nr:MBOAT family protein [Muribaculaceae bacterium]